MPEEVLNTEAEVVEEVAQEVTEEVVAEEAETVSE